MSTKKTLRQHLCKKRAGLTEEAQKVSADALSAIIQTTSIFMHSEHVAFYWPQRGEISPLPILKLAIQMEKKCYLPILDPNTQTRLLFAPYHPSNPLIPNRFGILEPELKKSNIIPPQNLNLVFLPLVAFGLNGQRLGMGGGYYDHTFDFLNQHQSRHNQKTYLLGIGYDFQCVDNLPQDIWDVLLNGIATETKYRDIR